MNKKIISILSVLVAGLLAFAGYYYQNQTITPADTNVSSVTDTAVPSSNTFTLILNLSSGQKSLKENFVAGTNLFDALKIATMREGIEMKFKEYPGMGVLVESIGSSKNGTGGKYWQFFVNGKYSNEGASSYEIKSGDVIEWKFSNEQ